MWPAVPAFAVVRTLQYILVVCCPSLWDSETDHKLTHSFCPACLARYASGKRLPYKEGAIPHAIVAKGGPATAAMATGAEGSTGGAGGSRGTRSRKTCVQQITAAYRSHAHAAVAAEEDGGGAAKQVVLSYNFTLPGNGGGVEQVVLHVPSQQQGAWRGEAGNHCDQLPLSLTWLPW